MSIIEVPQRAREAAPPAPPTLSNLWLTHRELSRVTVDRFPIALGEEGRGRLLARVVAAGGAPAPRAGEPISISVVTGSSVAVARVAPARGCDYLIAYTNPGYRRGVTGGVAVSGAAQVLLTGTWAYGDAGRTGSGEDALVQVDGPALLRVCGRAIVLVDGQGTMRRYEGRDELRVELLADEDPWARGVLRAVGRTDGAWASFLADIEAAEEAATVAPAGVVHHGLVRAELVECGLLVLADPGAGTGLTVERDGEGVARLVPGPHTLVWSRPTRAGGKRWSVGTVTPVGLEAVWSSACDGAVLYRVVDPGWSITVEHHRDGALDHINVLTSAGLTTPVLQATPEARAAQGAPSTKGLSHNPFAKLGV